MHANQIHTSPILRGEMLFVESIKARGTTILYGLIKVPLIFRYVYITSALYVFTRETMKNPWMEARGYREFIFTIYTRRRQTCWNNAALAQPLSPR